MGPSTLQLVPHPGCGESQDLEINYRPPDAVRNTLQRIGYRHIQTDPSNRSVSITQKGMVLDLGGIAKGYAADKMLQVIQSFGLSRCLIDAGGDIVLGMASKES